MLNRSTVDLESATVRTRYFGGRSADLIGDEMPILPVDSPGLPIPGPSFVSFAQTLGDTPNAAVSVGKKPRSGKVSSARPNGPYLHALTRSVLYQSGLSLPVHNSPIPYVFQPGVFATNDPAGDTYGPQPCRLMVVGKCLGPSEASAGRPFVGPASKPLWDTWEEAGIPYPSKDHPVFLTNLIRFVPPFDLARLPKQWVEDGVHLLMQEIAICRPQVLLLLGADALKAVFGPKARITDFRGRVADFEIDCRPVAGSPPDIHRCKVIAAEHPAAVSREPDIYPNLLAGVKLVAKELGFSAADQSVPLDHQAVYTLHELEAAVNQSIKASQAGGYVSFDCEWEGRHPTEPGAYVYTVQWSHAPGHARTVFIHRCGGLPNQALPLDKAVPLLKRLFEGAPKRGARLVAHFGKADLPWLLSLGVDLYPHFVGPDDDPEGTPNWLAGWEKSYFEGGFDTYVAAHAIEECFPAGTLVRTVDGDIPIEKIVNDRLQVDVLSMDSTFSKLLYRRVTGYVKKEPVYPVVKVAHSCGEFYCTANHKIWTINRGYVESWDLSSEDQLCVVRQAVPQTEVSKQQSPVLRSKLLGQMEVVAAGNQGETPHEGGLGQDQCEEERTNQSVPRDQTWSDAQGSCGEDDRSEDRQRYAQKGACVDWRGWKEKSSGGEAPVDVGGRVDLRAYCEDRERGPGAACVLLDRCGESVTHGGRGTGRGESHHSRGQEEGSTERQIYEQSRVVGVSIQELGVRSIPRGGDRSDPFVYCLQVEETHNFFADGVLVSNCGELKLEVLAATYANIPRYDTKILEWRDKYCKENKIRKSDLKGYGNIPEDLLIETRYTSYDADAAGRLYLKFNGDPRTDSKGMLDSDRFARSCRKIFGIRMRAWGAWCEMERHGLMIDRDAQRDLRTHLDRKRNELMDELRRAANWPELDLNKHRHKVEFLFGDQWIDWPRQRPQAALTLGLTPYKTTDSSYGGVLWAEAMSVYESEDNSSTVKPKPAADRETITHKAREHDLVKLMRDILFINTAMKITFRLPDQVDTESDKVGSDSEGEDISTPDSHEQFEAGLLSFVCGDERVRSVFGLVETGRASSSRPNLQNISARRDEQFNRILGWGDYAKEGDSAAKARKFSSRSVFMARPGWFLVFADLKGAEIVAAAIFSGDPTLLEHARRNNLPENHPDYLDLHSDLANKAFKLNLPFSEIKKKHKPLRVAAKATRFGKYYGASSETILRQALEETPDVTLEQIENLMDGHDAEYPDLIKFFETAEQRPLTHGWASNGFGGTRRFRRAGARDRQAAQGRESKNWTCQGLVADAMNVGLGNAWYEMRRRKMRSRIVLSVHDSAGFECPPDEVETVVDEILPRAFKDLLPITPTDLNGRPNGRPDCRFDIDVEVFRSWGVDIDESEWRTSRKGAGAKS